MLIKQILCQACFVCFIAGCSLLLTIGIPAKAAQAPKMVLQIGSPFSASAQWATAAHAPRVAASGPRGVEIWNTDTWELLRTIAVQVPLTYFNVDALSPNGSLLAVVTDHSELQLWDVNNGNLLWAVPEIAMGDPIFSPNGRLVAACTTHGDTDFWDVQTGHLKYMVPVNGNLAISPNNSRTFSFPLWVR